jgi:glycosyltransferase involved in cell wall biosynthesis
MHLSDTLSAGGLERVSVMIANGLPPSHYRAHLCTTRRDGPLSGLVAPHVARLRLERRGRFDTRAIHRLTAYIRKHEIALLHAHGTALFIAVVASLIVPRVRVIWHDHFGTHEIERRPEWLYRMAVRRAHGVIAVTEPLAEWARHSLNVPGDRVWYVPNFAGDLPAGKPGRPTLPGKPGFRIACVANMRPQKDHPNLIRAMREIVREVPEAHLLLFGAAADADYASTIWKEVEESGLSLSISWLGSRDDVGDVLRNCDIGVLSSASEGLPLALIEYGMSGLPVVATRVGQCAEVLDDGSAGVLVAPGAPGELAAAIVSLLKSPKDRAAAGVRLRDRVRRLYNQDRAIEQVCAIYDSVFHSVSGPARLAVSAPPISQ